MIKLQVMICTYGTDGIKRVASSLHPSVPQVEYIVGWQIDDLNAPLPPELERHDFKVFKHNTRGLSKNRNYLLSKATAPVLLISDDDVDYTASQLNSVIEAFENNPECDIITFKYSSINSTKIYPDYKFNLWNPPKGYYTSSIEIAIKRQSIQNQIFFNPLFGIGGNFIAGEEEIFLYTCKKSNLRACYIPIYICSHIGNTTSERELHNPKYIETKGAVFRLIHPKTWPLRMILHAYRERKNFPISIYILNWMKGASVNTTRPI